jgi:RNA polymerase sigma-70 factor (ECF subfamily)
MAAKGQQQLLDRARKGDRTALGDLLEQFRPYVRVLVQVAWHGGGTARQDSSDLIQDTMVVVQQAFPQFRGTSVPEFAGWLRTLTLRVIQQALRSHVATGKRSVCREEILQTLDHLVAPTATGPEEEARRQEQAAAVALALDRLPADMQLVLHGRFFEGLSYADLSARLQRTEGTLRVLYTRALRRLREELQTNS